MEDWSTPDDALHVATGDELVLRLRLLHASHRNAAALRRRLAITGEHEVERDPVVRAD